MYVYQYLTYIYVCIRRASLRKTKEDAEKTRQDLIDAGIDIFSENLYSTVSMSDIAKKAGVTRGAIYWHFKNKAELFMEIHNYVSIEIFKTIDNAIAKGKTIYERTYSIFFDLLMNFKTDTKLKKISRLMNVNFGILSLDEFKEWHKNQHLEEKQFYLDLMTKITEGIDMENLEGAENINPVHEFIVAAAFLHGMFEFISYGEEMEIDYLNNDDISSIIKIFLNGLCPENTFIGNLKAGVRPEKADGNLIEPGKNIKEKSLLNTAHGGKK